jgi:hypothetical protein
VRGVDALADDATAEGSVALVGGRIVTAGRTQIRRQCEVGEGSPELMLRIDVGGKSVLAGT